MNLPRAPNALADAGRDAAYPVSGIAPFDRRVIAVGAVVFAVLLAVAARFWFNRDELYFFECVCHLQARFVIQPVLEPLVAFVSHHCSFSSWLGLLLYPPP